MIWIIAALSFGAGSWLAGQAYAKSLVDEEVFGTRLEAADPRESLDLMSRPVEKPREILLNDGRIFHLETGDQGVLLDPYRDTRIRYRDVVVTTSSKKTCPEPGFGACSTWEQPIVVPPRIRCDR